MIFVHDRGRMANNILQYGHLYAWGREHGRQTMSMRFAYKYPYFHICHTRHHNFPTYVFAKYAAKWHLLPIVRFDEKEMAPDLLAEKEQQMLQHSCVAAGWYARWYDLFLKYKDEILQLFDFNDDIKQHVQSLLDHGDGSLGVHIRRGDYQTWYDGRFFYSDAQYISIIRQFLQLHPGKTFRIFICGNDPTLDREAYTTALPEADVVFPNGNPGEDLCLLSQCQWLIGPPSTFSLVASMYHDVPLYWIQDISQPLRLECFDTFDNLFRHIL